jgi:hypothetical protein
MKRKMDINFESSYIDYDSDDIPYSLYEIHGLNKIRELSRQLRTFINYKTATIQYRFCPKTITCLGGLDKKCNETKKNLKQNASKFVKLLIKIRGNRISYETELIRLVERVKFTEDKFSRDLLTDLRDLTQKLFINVHKLSEQEIHLHPKFLKFVVNLTQEACTVFKIFNNWASGYYEELRVNYHQLHCELNLLIPTEEEVEITTIRKQRSLEEGLKEW